MGHRMELALEVAQIRKTDMAAYLECNVNTLSRWLHGKTRPNKQTLRLWAMRTAVDLEWLETGGEPPASDTGRARRDSNPQPSDLVLRLLPGGLSVNHRLTGIRPVLVAVPDWRGVA